MIASDDSSDDSMSLPVPELGPPEEGSGSSKLKHDSRSDGDKHSPLKQAIKENENSIIQSILSPPPHLSILTTDGSNKNSNSNSTSDKTTPTTAVSEGLSPLLDYLFEDGQLTRIEYDIVDKGHGANSATEQVQILLRILMELKDDEALEILLECLNRLDPTSDTVRKLCSQFSPRAGENVVFLSETNSEEREATGKTASLMKKLERQQSDRNVRPISDIYLSLGGNRGSRKYDFYYGRRQIHHLHDPSRERWNGRDDSDGSKDSGSFRGRKLATQQQMNKTRELDPTDLRDFYLTNGCLETVRNLILDNSKESITAIGWEKVLRNMNGLLSTDVLSIKDLLFQIKTSDHQKAMETETKLAKVVRKIYRERRKLRHPGIPEKQKREIVDISESEEEPLKRYNDRTGKERKTRNESENKQESIVNWNQIIYHSLQMWKQRNGSNSTFYSLIGIFQHSKLYQTADLLLDYKKEIQLKENEKEEGTVIDVNNGTRTSTSSTMLEKSDFLRKFYTPSRRHENNGNSNTVSLVTTKDRVSVSPVLSLDLL